MTVTRTVKDAEFSRKTNEKIVFLYSCSRFENNVLVMPHFDSWLTKPAHKEKIANFHKKNWWLIWTLTSQLNQLKQTVRSLTFRLNLSLV